MSDSTPSTSAPDRLKAGVQRFQTQIYSGRAAEYQHAATTPQQPHTLFITCSDSRINVEALTSAGVGELFVTRNVGNMVPPYRDTMDSVAAVVEYAVNALKVQHIVVCGHSDCGAMKALLQPASTKALPAVRAWLTNAPAQGPSTEADSPQELGQTTEANVLAQLGNLKTHPAVADALAEGRLTLSGWVYDIGAGDVRIAADGQTEFTSVRATEAGPA